MPNSVTNPTKLAMEITANSVSYDLGPKLEAYRRNRVLEYVIWRVLDRDMDWFVLRDSAYEKRAPTDGIYKSEVFPGLWLDAVSLINGELLKVHEVLNRGLASSEHAAFAEELNQRAKR